MKIFGIEFGDWRQNGGAPSFYRMRKLGRQVSSIFVNKTRFPGNKWEITLYDELEGYEKFFEPLDGDLLPEEAMKKVDEFLLRMEKISSFQ